jgi:putative transcriptional regulator
LGRSSGDGARRENRRDRPHGHTDARLARHRLGLTQREFAAVIGTGVGTVRKWELGTRRPSGAARTLIEVIKREPKAVRRALKDQLAS